MNTAKSVQLTDSNNVNISPMTDLMSIYYEVETDDNIIARKFIYNDFPIGVTYKNVSINNIDISAGQYNVLNITENDKIQYIDANSNYCDIIVSDISMGKISGTNYYALHSQNYNLSQILFNYISKYDSSVKIGNHVLDVSNKINSLSTSYNQTIKIINTSISILDTSVNQNMNNIASLAKRLTYIQTTYNDSSIIQYAALSTIVQNNALIANKIYAVIYDPNVANINITLPTTYYITPYFTKIVYSIESSYQYIFYLKAISANKFDQNVQHVSKINGSNIIDLDWEVKFDFTNNKITWMRDQNKNSAPYDFKHIYATLSNKNDSINGKHVYTFNTIIDEDIVEASDNSNVVNNEIIQNELTNSYMPIFISPSTIMNIKSDTNKFCFIESIYINDLNIQNSITAIYCKDYDKYCQAQNPVMQLNMIDSSLYIFNSSLGSAGSNIMSISKVSFKNSFMSIPRVIPVIMTDNDYVYMNGCEFKDSSIGVQQNLTPKLYKFDIVKTVYANIIASNDLTNVNIINLYQQNPSTFSYNDAYYMNRTMYAGNFVKI